MKRYIQMTPKAQQALWCKISEGDVHIPTQFLIDGDSVSEYTVYNMNEDGVGFKLCNCDTLKFAKGVVNEINNTGDHRYRQNRHSNFFAGGAFAYKDIPIEKVKLKLLPEFALRTLLDFINHEDVYLYGVCYNNDSLHDRKELYQVIENNLLKS